MTAATFVIAFLTPPLSGPLCTGGCFEYPYTDVVSRFPRDYFWMFPAIFLFMIYIILMACIHHAAASDKKMYSLAGLSFAVMAAVILITDYFVQLSVIQPSLLKGETEGIALWSQYNPHGIFIAMEEIGYLIICVSLLFIAPVFNGTGRMHRLLRIVPVAGFLMAIGALIFISVRMGVMREYIFEISIISIVFLELLIEASLLSRVFYSNSLKNVE